MNEANVNDGEESETSVSGGVNGEVKLATDSPSEEPTDISSETINGNAIIGEEINFKIKEIMEGQRSEMKVLEHSEVTVTAAQMDLDLGIKGILNVSIILLSWQRIVADTWS